MHKDLKQKKLLYFSAGYMTNINYLIILLMISFYLEFDKNPYLSLIIFGVPAVISVVISSLVIRHNLLNNQSREQGLLRLALAHTPSILGLVAAFIYLFI